MTVVSLSKESNVPRSTIANWMARGSRPAVQDAYAIAQVLGVTVEELLTGQPAKVVGVPDRIQGIVDDLLILDDAALDTVGILVHGLADKARAVKKQTAG